MRGAGRCSDTSLWHPTDEEVRYSTYRTGDDYYESKLTLFTVQSLFDEAEMEVTAGSGNRIAVLNSLYKYL